MVKKEDKIYVYKMTTDNGGAPCVKDGLLSLAICKPQIRSTCDENDWIIGFGAKTTIEERLIYVAQITNKLAGGKYYRDSIYETRPDCIYQWNEEENEYHWVTGKKYHKDGKELEHDIGNLRNNYDKANTLLSGKFVYFGSDGTSEYKEKYPEIKALIEGLKQGHRVWYSKKLRKEMELLINKTMKLKGTLSPTESDTSRICNNDSDCHLCCWPKKV